MVAVGGPQTVEQAAPSLINRSPCVVGRHAAEAARVSAPSASDEEWEHCVSIMNPWRIEVERPRAHRVLATRLRRTSQLRCSLTIPARNTLIFAGPTSERR